jgi:hypothetical protein
MHRSLANCLDTPILMPMSSVQRMAAAILATILSCSFEGMAQTPQYVTLFSGTNGDASYPVQTNQVISVVGYSWRASPTLYANLPDGSRAYLTPYVSTSTSFGSQIPQIITGITNITVAYNGPTPNWATFQITTPGSANVVSSYVPADAVVIPTSATGNVQIILESSIDLVNWTAANPGTYGASSATNRFFRVRAVHN